MNINVGDEVTINGVVLAAATDSDKCLVKLPSGKCVILTEADINTIHPYKKPSKEDKRKGN